MVDQCVKCAPTPCRFDLQIRSDWVLHSKIHACHAANRWPSPTLPTTRFEKQLWQREGGSGGGTLVWGRKQEGTCCPICILSIRIDGYVLCGAVSLSASAQVICQSSTAAPAITAAGSHHNVQGRHARQNGWASMCITPERACLASDHGRAVPMHRLGMRRTSVGLGGHEQVSGSTSELY